jgi:hypothetical protein
MYYYQIELKSAKILILRGGCGCGMQVICQQFRMVISDHFGYKVLE